MEILLKAHSGLRWLVLAGLIIIVIKSLVGLFGGGKYSKFDKILGSATVGIMDLQLLSGLILYFAYSPYTKYFSFNMKNDLERFWAVEHLALMLIAIIFAHIGKRIAKKSPDASVQFRFQSIFFGMSLVLILLGIPWDRV